MDIETMSKEQLEEFVGAELQQIADNMYCTTDGKFSVKHVNYVMVEGIKDPHDLYPDFKLGQLVEVTQGRMKSASAARKWLKQAYKLYKYVLAAEESHNKYLAKHGYTLALGRDATVIRRRLERMKLWA